MLMAPKMRSFKWHKTGSVFVVDAATKEVSEVAVELGVSNGEMIEVTGDVQAGQSVVIRGNERLKSGQVIQVVAGQSEVIEQD